MSFFFTECMLPTWQFDKMKRTLITVSGAGCKEANGVYEHDMIKSYDCLREYDAQNYRRISTHRPGTRPQKAFSITVAHDEQDRNKWVLIRGNRKDLENPTTELYFQYMERSNFLPTETGEWFPASYNFPSGYLPVPTVKLSELSER